MVKTGRKVKLSNNLVAAVAAGAGMAEPVAEPVPDTPPAELATPR